MSKGKREQVEGELEKEQVEGGMECKAPGGCGNVNEEREICCDGCEVWFHPQCVGIKIRDYNEMGKNEELSWWCQKCGGESGREVEEVVEEGRGKGKAKGKMGKEQKEGEKGVAVGSKGGRGGKGKGAGPKEGEEGRKEGNGTKVGEMRGDDGRKERSGGVAEGEKENGKNGKDVKEVRKKDLEKVNKGEKEGRDGPKGLAVEMRGKEGSEKGKERPDGKDKGEGEEREMWIRGVEERLKQEIRERFRLLDLIREERDLERVVREEEEKEGEGTKKRGKGAREEVKGGDGVLKGREKKEEMSKGEEYGEDCMYEDSTMSEGGHDDEDESETEEKRVGEIKGGNGFGNGQGRKEMEGGEGRGPTEGRKALEKTRVGRGALAGVAGVMGRGRGRGRAMKMEGEMRGIGLGRGEMMMIGETRKKEMGNGGRRRDGAEGGWIEGGRAKEAAGNKKKMRMMMFGDSMLRGTEEYCEKRGVGIEVFGGITVRSLGMVVGARELEYEVVGLMAGTNDIRRIKGGRYRSEMEGNIREVLKEVKGNTDMGVKIVVMGVVNRRDIKRWVVEECNRGIEEACRKERCEYVEVGEWIDIEDVGKDGLHLNREGQHKLAELVVRMMGKGKDRELGGRK
jgi:PHD-finger